MKEWIPIPGTVTGRLIEAAVHLFQELEYGQVSVQAIAKEAGVTTGALYHHFGSKPELFKLIRFEMERRIADRMEGAVDAANLSGRAAAALSVTVGFEAACKLGVERIVGETFDPGGTSPIEVYLMTHCGETMPVKARVLSEVLRSALNSAIQHPQDRTKIREALAWVLNPV